MLLYGYGGYGISLTPAYSARSGRLLDHGVVYVVANLRGGGEYGEDWHDAGSLTKKQNVFDDFHACAKYLIDQKLHHARTLGHQGRQQRRAADGRRAHAASRTVRAVVAHVGIYDMLRVELSPNGAFNVTEFGTVKEHDQFQRALRILAVSSRRRRHALSAVLFLTGDNDPRVDPVNSRKMTARLQASGPSSRFYLRTTEQRRPRHRHRAQRSIAQDADVFAFLFAMLKVQ